MKKAVSIIVVATSALCANPNASIEANRAIIAAIDGGDIDGMLQMAQGRIPRHIVGPQRFFMASRILKGWSTYTMCRGLRGLIANQIDMERSFNWAMPLKELKIEPVPHKPLNMHILDRSFYDALPLSCWVKLDISDIKKLSTDDIERVKKAWVDAQRDINNLILPVPAKKVSVASASASAASTASTQATSNQDQKS